MREKHERAQGREENSRQDLPLVDCPNPERGQEKNRKNLDCQHHPAASVLQAIVSKRFDQELGCEFERRYRHIVERNGEDVQADAVTARFEWSALTAFL